MLSDLLSQAPNTEMLISVYLLGYLFYVKDKSMFFKVQEMLQSKFLFRGTWWMTAARILTDLQFCFGIKAKSMFFATLNTMVKPDL